jgi:hypothetical protein
MSNGLIETLQKAIEQAEGVKNWLGLNDEYKLIYGEDETPYDSLQLYLLEHGGGGSSQPSEPENSNVVIITFMSVGAMTTSVPDPIPVPIN